MASKASVAKQKKREALVKKFAQKRAELLEQGNRDGLKLLPRNSSKTRLRNRCGLTGRSRGYIRRFGLSRIVLRQKAMTGELPGVSKISW